MSTHLRPAFNFLKRYQIRPTDSELSLKELKTGCIGSRVRRSRFSLSKGPWMRERKADASAVGN
jgi:hypothetical protein